MTDKSKKDKKEKPKWFSAELILHATDLVMKKPKAITPSQVLNKIKEKQMNKLTDLEICKRIADIEGLLVVRGDGENKNCIYDNWQTSERYGIILHDKYNPLTDDALCFRLMIKYQVNLFAHDYGYYSTLNSHHSVTRDYYESPNRVICLAIIAANEVN